MFSGALPKLMPLLENLEGYKFKAVNFSEISYSLSNTATPKIWINGVLTSPPDIFFILDTETETSYPISTYLESIGAINVNSVAAKRTTCSKAVSYKTLADANIPVIKSLVCKSTTDILLLLQELGLPMTIKQDDTYSKQDLAVIQSKEELKNVLSDFDDNVSLVAQSYIPSSTDKLLQVITIGEEVVFVTCKQNGEEHIIEPTEEIKTFCDKIVAATNLNFSKITLLSTENGYVVSEINSGDGSLSWLDKADLIPVFLELFKNLSANNPWPKWHLADLMQKSKTTQLCELLLELEKPQFLKAVQTLFENCEQTQETMLLELIKNCADTEYGRLNNFKDIKSVDDFRKAIPLNEWDTFAPYCARMEKGEEDLLFPGQADYFYATSGSIGSFRYIPESARETIAREAIAQARLAYNLLNFGENAATRVFAFMSRSVIDATDAGIPRGTASGRSGDLISATLLSKLAFPQDVVNTYEGESLLYMMMRCALVFSDLTAIVGNNAGMLKTIVIYAKENAATLIKDIKTGQCQYNVPLRIRAQLAPFLRPNPKRADELQALLENDRFYPRYYWPKIAVASFWLGGSVGAYVDGVREYLPKTTQFVDVGYGASEAKFNIPLKAETAAGALSTFSVFFEFIPIGGGETLLAHELEDGKDYEMLITTYAGLYRFKLHDIIRVEGFTGNTPNIKFIAKMGDVANLAQEKIPGADLDKVIRDTMKEYDNEVLCVQVFPDSTTSNYKVYIEFEPQENVEGEGEDLQTIADQALCNSFPPYKFFRKNKAIQPLTLIVTKSGWAKSLTNQHSKGDANSSQAKIPVVIHSPIAEEWLD